MIIRISPGSCESVGPSPSRVSKDVGSSTDEDCHTVNPLALSTSRSTLHRIGTGRSGKIVQPANVRFVELDGRMCRGGEGVHFCWFLLSSGVELITV